MSIVLKALTLNTAKLPEMVNFFSALGIDMQQTKVNKGSTAFKGQTGDMEICLISIPKRERGSTPELSMRIHVKNIEEVVGKLHKMAEVQILMDLQEMPFGKLAVVLDPDGNSFEICD